MICPLVSISCICYNHAEFIRSCLDSLLSQQTSFPFEIVIHDDASTDGTREIIEEYAARYPNIIFPKFQTENQYSKGVRGIMARFNFPRCRGKYIALCEGDDYWTDPYKLQKQVDFLQRNANYSAAFHAVNVEHDGVFAPGTELSKADYDLADLTERNCIHTLSIVWRKELLKDKYEEFASFPMGDYPMFIFLAEKGTIRYFPEVMGVYRIHGKGVWSSLSELERAQKLLAIPDYFLPYFSSKNVDEVVINNLKKMRNYCVNTAIGSLAASGNFDKLLEVLDGWSSRADLWPIISKALVANLKLKDSKYKEIVQSKKMRLANLLTRPFGY